MTSKAKEVRGKISYVEPIGEQKYAVIAINIPFENSVKMEYPNAETEYELIDTIAKIRELADWVRGQGGRVSLHPTKEIFYTRIPSVYGNKELVRREKELGIYNEDLWR